MREARINKNWIFIDDQQEPNFKNGTFVGICLGADHVAEHEHGHNFNWICGMNSSNPGLEGYLVGVKENFDFERFKDRIKLFKSSQYAALYLGEDRDFSNFKLNRNNILKYFEIGIPRFWNKEKKKWDGIDPEWEFSSSWDEDSLVIITRLKYYNRLELLYNAAFNKNLVIYIMSTKNPFDRGGLTLALLSEIPQKLKE